MPRFRPRSLIFAMAVLSAIGGGCSSSSSNSTRVVETCSPGEVVTCRTSSGCAAEKVCRADGKGFEACFCKDGGGGSAGSGGAGAAGGAVGSGGSAGSSTGGTGGSSTGGSSTGGSGAGGSSTGGTGTGGSSTGGSSTGGTGTGGSGAVTSDAGACDLVTQNCATGSRCLDSGAGPRCLAISGAPRQLDQSCSRSSGGDNCDRGLVCLDGNATGICRRYCGEEIHCTADSDCVHVDQGGRACHRQCLPDAPGCPTGQACYVAATGPLLTFCYAAGTVTENSPCDQRNDCLPGNACATVPAGTGCGLGQEGQCCARFCRDATQCDAGESCIRFDMSAPYGFCWT